MMNNYCKDCDKWDYKKDNFGICRNNVRVNDIIKLTIEKSDHICHFENEFSPKRINERQMLHD